MIDNSSPALGRNVDQRASGGERLSVRGLATCRPSYGQASRGGLGEPLLPQRGHGAAPRFFRPNELRLILTRMRSRVIVARTAQLIPTTPLASAGVSQRSGRLPINPLIGSMSAPERSRPCTTIGPVSLRIMRYSRRSRGRNSAPDARFPETRVNSSRLAASNGR